LPSSITEIVCKLGRNVRRVALLDQGRLRPKDVVLPQCAHFAISTILSQKPVPVINIIKITDAILPDSSYNHPPQAVAADTACAESANLTTKRILIQVVLLK
jgi:hypothetical protein